MTGLQEDYRVGDIIAVNCSSSRSRPQSRLKWLINNEVAPRKYLTGPWYRISRERPDAKETILQLRFIVKQEHFKNGILQLKVRNFFYLLANFNFDNPIKRFIIVIRIGKGKHLTKRYKAKG